MTQAIATSSTDAERWHREFAKRCNNRAWELTVRARNAAEDREMLDLAHASAWHWAQIGTELNRMRATMLVAEVHALLDHGRTALALASEMRDYFLQKSDTPDWEIAFTHAIFAHAAHAAGDGARHREAYGEAERALAAIAAAEDREIVAETFRQIPAPKG